MIRNTCVGPAYWAETELIGDRDEVDSYEGEIVGDEDLLCSPTGVVVSGVTEDNHAETDTKSRDH